MNGVNRKSPFPVFFELAWQLGAVYPSWIAAGEGAIINFWPCMTCASGYMPPSNGVTGAKFVISVFWHHIQCKMMCWTSFIHWLTKERMLLVDVISTNSALFEHFLTVVHCVMAVRAVMSLTMQHLQLFIQSFTCMKSAETLVSECRPAVCWWFYYFSAGWWQLYAGRLISLMGTIVWDFCLASHSSEALDSVGWVLWLALGF